MGVFEGRRGQVASLAEACQAAKSSPSSSLATVANRYLRSAAVQPESTGSIGRLLVAVAQMLWSLYVSKVPVDPAVAQNAKRAFLARLEGRHLEDVALFALTDLDLRGGATGPRAKLLLRGLEVVRERLLELGPTLVDRPSDPATLAALFSELASCSSTVFDGERLDALMSASASSTYDDEWAQRAQTTLQSAISARQRLRIQYGARYDDLLKPIETALALLIIGLSVAGHDVTTASSPASTSIWSPAIAGMVSFPTLAAADTAATSHLPVSLKSSSPSVLPPSAPPLLRILGYLRGRADAAADLVEDLKTLATTFDQLYQMWAIDRRRAEEVAEVAAREYRARGGTTRNLGADDEEDDERDFRELFPDADAAIGPFSLPCHEVCAHAW